MILCDLNATSESMELTFIACDSTNDTDSAPAEVIEIKENFLDNYKAELLKLPASTVQNFVKKQAPDYDVINTPNIDVFGVGKRCQICYIPFKSLDTLELHRETAHNRLRLPAGRPMARYELSPYKDAKSSKSISYGQMLAKRLSFDSPRLQKKCKFCSQEFTFDSLLRKHEANHDIKLSAQTPTKFKKTSYKCSICSEEFDKQLILAKHQQTHSKRKF